MEIGDGPYQVKVEGQETRKGRSGDDLRKGESRKGKSELLCGGRRGTRERGGLPLWLTTVVPGTLFLKLYLVATMFYCGLLFQVRFGNRTCWPVENRRHLYCEIFKGTKSKLCPTIQSNSLVCLQLRVKDGD